MADILSVGIDLGCDTLKLSYAYLKSAGGKDVAYGKFEKNETVRHVAIPAVAYYDGAHGWIFGGDVEKGEEKPFVSVVKIKSLFSLLSPDEAAQGEEVCPDRRYFYEEQYFPKFFFPNGQRDLKNFGKTIDEGLAFRAEGYTPQKVCREFFAYARDIVAAKRSELEKKTGRRFDELRLSLVYPARCGKLYREELTSTVKTAFGKSPYKVMNCGRALSMFAKERGAVAEDEDVLIFDMGEDTLSVLKCFINDDGKVVVEPAADHSQPADIGGVDVDFSIADYIERNIEKRETVGSPSYGEDGHIYEEGLQAKQYLFLKEIKKAKLLLSIPSLGSVFAKGVPVSLHRELYLQLTLTREQLEESVGITSNDGIARKILDYVLEELSLDVNADVKKVFFTGGLAETCGLLDYVKREVKKRRPDVTLRTFEDNVDNGDGMVIQTYEDSVYAPSVGAAIVALRDLDVSAGLTYSYGTWMSLNGQKILVILVGRGHMFDENAPQRLYTPCNLQGTLPEEFFSVRLSQGSIRKRRHSDKLRYVTAGQEVYLCIGEPNSPERKTVERMFQLKNISGPRAQISCTHRGRTIVRCEPKIAIIEGVESQPGSSVMKPFVDKHGSGARRIAVRYKDGGTGTVKESDIKVGLIGVKSFEGETD